MTSTLSEEARRELAIACQSMWCPPWYTEQESGDKASRIARAYALVESGRVTSFGGGWHVQGMSRRYTVSKTTGCDCEDALYRSNRCCYHRVAGELYERWRLRIGVSAGHHAISKEVSMPITTSNTDPFALTESLPALSFRDAPIGTTHTGTILTEAELVQSRNYESGELDFWDEAKTQPVMCAVVSLVLPSGEARSVWARKPSALFTAIALAQKEAGAGPMVPGGTLSITFTGTEPHKTNPRLSPRKLYKAVYTPPAPVSAFDLPSAEAGRVHDDDEDIPY